MNSPEVLKFELYMPKIGMEKIRKQQLIDATLASIAQHGMHGTTISTISKLAGVSSGIISHYFGGKAGLLKGTTIYLLEQLKQDFLQQFTDSTPTPKERLAFIINANFSTAQSSNKAAVAWLSFWVQSMHDKELSQLQRVNHARLASNLRYSFKALIKRDYLDYCTNMLAAQIDGQWLRCALSQGSNAQFLNAANYCHALAEQLIDQYSN
ncbi:HTH-type transcriptional regulator BetI [Thalassotalea insulae]|uniref:HTH-type transcriptional regulator BetI n=2 Tax=Thalassotalea insulae TaxID=2056778 RepID=A0ABQ6GL91_9GAMM|nr:HTH-type transcriptional regulator BetI [Thalassotalea insulae]